jgi:molybdopterin-guanine dinucleotide biosynthesis protein B
MTADGRKTFPGCQLEQVRHHHGVRAMRQPVLGIAGWKNSGKTTLTERLIAELSGRGYTISSVKHAHHEANVDREGTDSWRHRAAGAREVGLVTARRWALMHELREEPEPTLTEILSRFSPVDLIIVEGFKFEPIPKIVMLGAERPEEPLHDDPNVLAVIGDGKGLPVEGLPSFDRNDVSGIADFIIGRLLRTSPSAADKI